MDRAQLRRSEHRLLVARVPLHFVGDTELLEEPENPLRARILEMMHGQHGDGSIDHNESQGTSDSSTWQTRFVTLLVQRIWLPSTAHDCRVLLTSSELV